MGLLPTATRAVVGKRLTQTDRPVRELAP